MRNFNPGNRLIVALDVPTASKALELIERLDGAADFVKVGLQLFIAEGPRFVENLVVRYDQRVMLDLKLHDIPNTVKEAAKECASTGAELITIHAGGGMKMLEAAVEGAGPNCETLAVTVLTSLDVYDLQQISGTDWDVRDTVLARIHMAEEAGCSGIVCSPKEAKMIRHHTVDADFLVVTPGIRMPGGDVGDQKRTMTPAEARKAGADLIVVGRPIRNSDNPKNTARFMADCMRGVE